MTPLLSAFESESTSNASVLETDNDGDRRHFQQQKTVVNGGNNGLYGRYGHARICSGAGLEHEAGDEIDRMLDEMVDSDDEIEFNWLSGMKGQPDKLSVSANPPDSYGIVESQARFQH